MGAMCCCYGSSPPSAAAASHALGLHRTIEIVIYMEMSVFTERNAIGYIDNNIISPPPRHMLASFCYKCPPLLRAPSAAAASHTLGLHRTIDIVIYMEMSVFTERNAIGYIDNNIISPPLRQMLVSRRHKCSPLPAAVSTAAAVPAAPVVPIMLHAMIELISTRR